MKWKKDLIKDIRCGRDDQDHPVRSGYRGPEFTECNRKHLKESFLSVANNCKVIVEIGVCRNGKDSSTYVFLNNKKENTLYLGVDLMDKSFLNDAVKNIHTLQTDSSNYEQVVSKLRGLGVDEIDYLFIDGWHSINQVYKDWEYTNILSKNGIVGFHDINYHPGPSLFIQNLNPDIWDIKTYCPNDYGIGFVK